VLVIRDIIRIINSAVRGLEINLVKSNTSKRVMKSYKACYSCCTISTRTVNIITSLFFSNVFVRFGNVYNGHFSTEIQYDNNNNIDWIDGSRLFCVPVRRRAYFRVTWTLITWIQKNKIKYFRIKIQTSEVRSDTAIWSSWTSDVQISGN